MQDYKTVEEKLKGYRYLHKYFYREYVESGGSFDDREQEPLTMAMMAKANYYRLKSEFKEPHVIFSN